MSYLKILRDDLFLLFGICQYWSHFWGRGGGRLKVFVNGNLTGETVTYKLKYVCINFVLYTLILTNINVVIINLLTHKLR